MRYSRVLGSTLRETPSDALSGGQALLMRAGYLRFLGVGLPAWLPLGKKLQERLMVCVRKTLAPLDAQEVETPSLSLDAKRGLEKAQLTTASGAALTLEANPLMSLLDLARGEIRSYRQLPVHLFQFKTRWQPAEYPGSGLLDAHEETLLDLAGIYTDSEQQKEGRQAIESVLRTCLNVCGLAAREAGQDLLDTGREWFVPLAGGKAEYLVCSSCGSAARRETASFRRPVVPAEAPLPVKKVATPGQQTIAEVASFLGVPESRTAKAVFLAEERNAEPARIIFAVVRGDMDVSLAKITRLLGAGSLRPATNEEICSIGAAPGYASPIGVRGALVVMDESIAACANLVAGANEEGYHLLNVNAERDFPAGLRADIALAAAGDACQMCGGRLESLMGELLAWTAQPGEALLAASGCDYLDSEGKTQQAQVVEAHIHLGRLLALAAEVHQDGRGLIWPQHLAPYPVHLVELAGKTQDLTSAALKLTGDLAAQKIEVLWDDRAESAGVKFNDADLIGSPLRITLSERAIKQGGLEFKNRRTGEMWIVSLEDAPAAVRAFFGDDSKPPYAG